MPVTRDDVARSAGVSPAVVSYVLNDGPRPVSEKSRRKVLAAIQELNYRPHAAARALRGGHTRTLGLVVPDTGNPFFAELAKAVGDAAFTHGFGLLICDSADSPDRERAHITSLAERRVTGIVLVSTVPDQDVRDLLDLSIPVVALDRSPDDSPVSTIRADHEAGALVATEHLVGHGHRAVAFVGGPDLAVSSARRRGWRRALESNGITEAASTREPFTYAGGGRAARALFGSVQGRPTAVVVSSDVQALGLLNELDLLGLSVPGDVAVVSFDGTVAGRFAVPTLTSVVQPVTEMGAVAVARITEGGAGAVHLELATHLQVGRSCGCSSV